MATNFGTKLARTDFVHDGNALQRATCRNVPQRTVTHQRNALVLRNNVTHRNVP